jgi:hypothetical protein
MISTTNFIEIIDGTYDMAMSKWSEALEEKESGDNYYVEVLEKVNEEMDTYMTRLENISGALDHVYNIATLINGETDYTSIGTVLAG